MRLEPPTGPRWDWSVSSTEEALGAKGDATDLSLQLHAPFTNCINALKPSARKGLKTLRGSLSSSLGSLRGRERLCGCRFVAVVELGSRRPSDSTTALVGRFFASSRLILVRTHAPKMH